MSPRPVLLPSSRPSNRKGPRRALGALACTSLFMSIVGGVASMGGCPIYSADSCAEDPNCVPPRTKPTPSPTNDCALAGCRDGYVCSAITTGRNTCIASDCRADERKCADGSKCVRSDAGVWACATDAPLDCAKTGCVPGMTCATMALGRRVCVSTDPNACTADDECRAGAKFGPGSLCLGGVCKAAKDLCSDATQCRDGASCADGRCTPKCATSCAVGYTCDAKTTLCTGGAAACNATTPCAGAGVCVGGRCTEKCGVDGGCKAGLVCAGGGCVVDDRPIFFCDKTGDAEGKRDACAERSICLHHNCYVACNGAADTTTCAKGDFPVCKPVTSSSGANLAVCGTATSLGSQCDLTVTPSRKCQGAGQVCIDGYCR